MRATGRLWRTGDGRLVLDGDPAAAVLAYGPGDEVSAADTKRLPGEAPAAEPPAEEPEKPEPDDEPEKVEKPARGRGRGGKPADGGRW